MPEGIWLPMAVLCSPLLFLAGMLDVFTIYWTYAYGLFVLQDSYWIGILMQMPCWVPIIALIGLAVVPVAVFRGPSGWPKAVLTTYRIEFTTPVIFFAPKALRWLPWASRNFKIHAFASYSTQPKIWAGLLGADPNADTDGAQGLRLMEYFKATVDKKNAWQQFMKQCPYGETNWPERAIDVRDGTGATSLFHVFVNFKESNGVYAVEKMIKAGFDVNAQDRRGNTAIHNGRMVNMRLKIAGVIVNSPKYDWNRTNDDGQTAAMYWAAVADERQKPAEEGKDMFHGMVNPRQAKKVVGWLRGERKKVFPKADDEAALKKSLVSAADNETLHRVPLYDLLWDEPSAAKRKQRQLLVFGIINELVSKCHSHEGATLSPAEKRLLKFLFIASMGPVNSSEDPRKPYRSEMKTAFDKAMASFEEILSRHYTELSERKADTEAKLIDMPDKVFVDAQFVHQCPSGFKWARNRSLAGAYAALRDVGAILGVSDLSQLIATGRHRYMADVHPDGFHDFHSWEFWARLVALYLLGACEKAYPAFDKACAALAEKIDGADWSAGGMKKFERTWTKTLEYIDDKSKEVKDVAGKISAPGFVVDMMRGSITVGSAADLVKVCEAIEASDTWLVLKRKNGFSPSAEAIGGYRDVKYILRISDASASAVKTKKQQRTGGNDAKVTPLAEISNNAGVALDMGGATGEIQILLKSTANVKKSMHPIYTAARGDYDHEKWR